MGPSAQTVDDDGFDRAAAQAYLQDLRGRAAGAPVKITRRGPGGASVVKPAARAPARDTSPRGAARRPWTATTMAMAAPVAIGLAIGFWATSRPEPSPDAASAPLAPRQAVNAYSITTPVPADDAATEAASTTLVAIEATLADVPAVYRRHRRYAQASTPAPGAGASASIEEPAPDFLAYGILDPSPSGGRSGDGPKN